MINKNPEAQKAAVDEYFKHWETEAKDETAEDRLVCSFPIHFYQTFSNIRFHRLERTNTPL